MLACLLQSIICISCDETTHVVCPAPAKRSARVLTIIMDMRLLNDAMHNAIAHIGEL